MKKQMLSEDVEDIFKLETELFPCLVDMRFLGVRVDVEAAISIKTDTISRRKRMPTKIKKETSVDIQIWAARSIAKVFQKLRLPYDRTAKNKFSIIY